MTTPAQRTPVSLLLDMCNQNQWNKPEYILTEVQGASHDPTFTYKVTIEDVTATASGQSKMKAKHFAAKSALEQLLSKGKSFCFEFATVTSDTLKDIISEPSSEIVPVGKDARNAIGELQEFCVKRKMMPPYYEAISESGPPHDKTFSLQCIVDYSFGGKTYEERFSTFGEGKTKRIAKREAAEIMYNKLNEHERINNIEPPKKEIKEYPEFGNEANLSSHSETSDDHQNQLVDDLSNGTNRLHVDSD